MNESRIQTFVLKKSDNYETWTIFTLMTTFSSLLLFFFFSLQEKSLWTSL